MKSIVFALALVAGAAGAAVIPLPAPVPTGEMIVGVSVPDNFLSTASPALSEAGEFEWVISGLSLMSSSGMPVCYYSESTTAIKSIRLTTAMLTDAGLAETPPIPWSGCGGADIMKCVQRAALTRAGELVGLTEPVLSAWVNQVLQSMRE